MLTVGELKALLGANGLRLSKRLGQHHLVDGRIIERLVASCDLTGDDTVVEIGAGLGALTEPVAARAGRIIAIEVDRRICELLSARMKPLANVTVCCEDVLSFSWPTMRGAVIIGAIPYHITSPIIVSLCEQRALLKAAWLLVQREVAQRLLAAPGTKAYGRLSVLCQYGWELSEVMKVSRSAFYPQPAVDSSWLRMLPQHAPSVAVDDEAWLFEVVKAAFGQRRKTLANCLRSAGMADHTNLGGLLRQLKLPPDVRAERLTLEQFAALATALKH
jgi:16S rRNA (adenine1518-N6/adenine1519-N6)-dimethyltransferase